MSVQKEPTTVMITLSVKILTEDTRAPARMVTAETAWPAIAEVSKNNFSHC